MSDKEILNFMKLLQKEKKAASDNTKEQAEDFLKKVGILKPNGTIAKQYKGLCIPKD